MLCYTKVLLRWIDHKISHIKTVKYVLPDRLDKYAIQNVSGINKILILWPEVKGFRETMSNLNTIRPVHVMVDCSGNV